MYGERFINRPTHDKSCTGLTSKCYIQILQVNVVQILQVNVVQILQVNVVQVLQVIAKVTKQIRMVLLLSIKRPFESYSGLLL